MIAFPPFEPSRSMFAADATSAALNMKPNADGWGPINDLAPYTQPLPDQCKGAIYVKQASGAVIIFAGTATKLYRLNTLTLAWDDVSRATGGNYGVPATDAWSFTLFGNTLIACNITDDPQAFDIAAGTRFAALGGTPPKARYVWTAGDFVVLGSLTDNPSRIQWSGLNDATFWTVGLRGADYQTFPDGGEVQGGITDRQGAFVLQRNSIRYMGFAPQSGFTFNFELVNPYRGAASPLSIVSVGPQDFVYLSEDGFFRGAASQPIGAERVDEWFFSREVNLDGIELVQGVADPYNKLVWWQYQDRAGKRRLIGYNWQLDRWCRSDLAANYLVAMLTAGFTWDALAVMYSSIDAVTEPFDSRLFKGGRPTFAGFDAANRMGYFTGLNLAASIETASVELQAGGRAFVNGVRVVTDALAHTSAVGTSPSHGQPIAWRDPASPSPVTGLVPARADGRLHRFRVAIPAGTDWTHIHGIEPQAKATGRR